MAGLGCPSNNQCAQFRYQFRYPKSALDSLVKSGRIAAMFDFQPIPYTSKPEFYRELHAELAAMYVPTWFTNLANTSAALMAHLPGLNWVGFYLLREGELQLGPFQGLPA